MFLTSKHTLLPEQLEQRKLEKMMFPNQISLGSFTPHSTIVEVTAFRQPAVEAAFKLGNLMTVRRDLQVLCHEMTHWFDFFGTRWGRDYAVAICKALRAMVRNREDGFHDVVELFDLDRRVLAPSYYKYVNQPKTAHGMDRPWSIHFSGGVEIDPSGHQDNSKPIFFARFGENGHGSM